MPLDSRRVNRKLPRVWPMVIELVNAGGDVTENRGTQSSSRSRGPAYFGLVPDDEADGLSVFEQRQQQRAAERSAQDAMRELEKKRGKIRGGPSAWGSAAVDVSQHERAIGDGSLSSDDDIFLNDAQKETRRREKEAMRKQNRRVGRGALVKDSGRKFRRTVNDWHVHDSLFDRCYNPRDDALQARTASEVRSAVSVSPAPRGSDGQRRSSAASEMRRPASHDAPHIDPQPVSSMYHSNYLYEQQYPGRSGLPPEQAEYYGDVGSGGVEWSPAVTDQRRAVYNGANVDTYRPGLVIAGEPYPREIPKAAVRLRR